MFEIVFFLFYVFLALPFCADVSFHMRYTFFSLRASIRKNLAAPDPNFSSPIANITVPVGREAVLTCVVHDLFSYKVRIKSKISFIRLFAVFRCRAFLFWMFHGSLCSWLLAMLLLWLLQMQLFRRKCDCCMPWWCS